MKNWMLQIAIVLLLSGVGSQSFSQEINVSKVKAKAEKLFGLRNYNDALPFYRQLEKAGVEVDQLSYKIAKCLFESKETNDQVESINYFESIDEASFEKLPHGFYLDIADAYMVNSQIEQALIYYNKQVNHLGSDKRAIATVSQKIEQANNAYSIMRIPKNVIIKELPKGINTEYIEYNPVVSADESVLAFTTLRPADSKTGSKVVEEIFISYNETGTWSIPQKVDVKTDNNYGTAGISADGQEMLVFIGDKSSGSIFTISRDGKMWSRPIPLGAGVQSRYMESTASITADSKTIYFASNRPGGYGGMDIYRSDRKEDGSWGKAVNLGPEINTKANEDAPFIHPNKKLLFFTTDGHNGMGGNDIYKAELVEGKWTKLKNMGYPINTTANDNYFTLIADGSKGYFSSDRPGGLGGQDIYVMDMPEDYETIPLTLIKGRILDAETHQPLETKIYMVDSETKEKIDYIYHPSKNTGDYLVILPPSKNYDMIIESEGFLPYTLNIDIPNQTEFHELYQKIFLKTIKHFDVVVGQEVQIKNAFYETHEEGKSSMRKDHEAALIEYDSIDVYELMGSLMEAGDQAGIDYLVELLLIKNPIDEVVFEESNDKLQAAKRTYYYDESDESKFEKKVVGDEVIYSLPTMFVSKEAAEQQKNNSGAAVAYDRNIFENTVKIYFSASKSELSSEYTDDLENILSLIKEHDGLGIEISGYASSEGNEEYNKKLSNQRAISVLNFFNHKGIVRRRIIAKGFGAAENTGASKEESRRVEVRIVDLNKI